MNLLNFLFLAAIDGNLLPSDMVSRDVIVEKINSVSWAVIQADLLLQNGIGGAQMNFCGDPAYPVRRKIDILPNEQREYAKKRRSAFDNSKESAKIIPVQVDDGQAIYGSCTANSFSKYHIKRHSEPIGSI